MKKIGLIIAGMFLSLFLLAGGVWAAGQASTNGKITITDTDGPDLEYEESPNVHMYYTDESVTGTDGYSIASLNEKGVMEYGIVSNFSGYYQHTVSVGETTAATGGNSTIITWIKIGGEEESE